MENTGKCASGRRIASQTPYGGSFVRQSPSKRVIMEAHHHSWDKSAAQRLLNGREKFENTAFLKDIFGPEKQVIADIGCGPGFYAKKLKPFASRLYCIDSSKAMISAARKTVHGKNVRFLKEDASRISLPDSSADAVFMANSFHDMDRKGAAAGEVIRILKPGGRIIIVDWRKGAGMRDKQHSGPPDNLRMSEEEYLAWFPGFSIKKRFKPGHWHFGLVISR